MDILYFNDVKFFNTDACNGYTMCVRDLTDICTQGPRG